MNLFLATFEMLSHDGEVCMYCGNGNDPDCVVYLFVIFFLCFLFFVIFVGALRPM